MTFERTAGICLSIAITSASATGEPKRTTAGNEPQGPARSVSAGTYADDGIAPLRRVQSRRESGGREVIVETVETLDIEGRFGPIEETVTESTRPAPNTSLRRQDVFRLTVDRRRVLSETTESRQETQPRGDTTVHNTWTPDLNGQLRLTSRVIEETTSSAPDLRQTDSTLLVPSINGTLRESERIESTARRISPAVVRHDSTHLARDVNGRWRATEIRRGDVREVGSSARVEEETIQRPDLNGTMTVTETIRRSDANEQNVVIETYAPYTEGAVSAGGRPALSERVRRTTTPTADGGRYTVEEVEARSRVAPSEPLRVVRQTVTTVRRVGTDEWVTERQVFERDVNGRLRLVRND